MATTREAKQAIMLSLNEFNASFNRRPNALLIQTFFDAKADEIVDIFSAGPEVDFSDTKRRSIKWLLLWSTMEAD